MRISLHPIDCIGAVTTQVSPDLTDDDIRHLHADQEFCGVVGCFGLILLKTLGQADCWAASANTQS
jgi:hypothetical protein